jgi:hypothetical protein
MRLDFLPQANLLLIALLAVITCTPPPEEIEPFIWVRALEGDGRVTVQFWLNEETLLDQGARLGHFKLLRAEGESKFEEVAELGPINPLRATWCWTDSSVTNGKSYRYLVHAIFAIFEDPDAEGFSDTLVVTPQTSLADPRPQPPESLRNKALLADTVTLLWNELPEHDSLYYLLYYSPYLDEFTTYEEYLDAAGHEWNPTGGDLGVHPVHLDSAIYTFYCDRDGETRSYRIIAFVDSIMSYPSEILEIEHTWQGGLNRPE